MMELNQNQREDNFYIEIDYQRDTNPAIIFQTMAELVNVYQDFDVEIANIISANIEPKLMLERVDSGSVRTWLVSQLKDIDDEAIKKLDWKNIIGKLLIKCKYFLINKLENTYDLDNNKIILIQNELNEIITETQIKHLSSYRSISQKTIIQTYFRTAKSVSSLGMNDKASFHCTYGEIKFERKTHISEEIIENLLVAKKDTSESNELLKVKKPDYLGDSRWLFYLHKHPIEASIEDKEWLAKFRNREVILCPGDFLQVKLKTEIRFDNEGMILPTRYYVIKINDIIEGENDNTELTLF